jgi:hypothetical protein
MFREQSLQAPAQEVSMSIRRLEPREWGGFCVFVSRGFIGKHVELEVGSLQIGFQVQARRVPLLGMSYDPERDLLEILMGDMDHLIPGPREFYVDDAPAGEIQLQIVDADGVRQIITLRDPLMLQSQCAFRSEGL